jgi:cellulose synthase/poly-beta-1,6-N-acetylglucosamine synthase-like glycosyltransferase
MSIPITFLCTVYNEENRIRFTLDHATKWADEVLIVDKSSTDATKKICEEYNNVRVVTIPFSIKGGEDVVDIVSHAKHDWVFICSASEVPTKRCIKACKNILEQTNGKLDLIRIPRKYYSFGIYHSRSPWGVTHFPFFINRKQAIIQNVIHNNFLSHGMFDPKYEAIVPFSEECCVHHFTHPSAKQYVEDMLQYMMVEANECKDEKEVQAKINNSMKSFSEYISHKWQAADMAIFGHMCALAIYYYGVGLFCWEKERGLDVSSRYKDLTESILNSDWK